MHKRSLDITGRYFLRCTVVRFIYDYQSLSIEVALHEEYIRDLQSSHSTRVCSQLTTDMKRKRSV